MGRLGDVNTWDMRKTIGVVAVAAGVAGVGGAAIAAATETGYHAGSGGFGGFGGAPGGPGGPPPAERHSGAEPEALHGEYVVPDGRGGFTTVVSQTGRVTAIAPNSVTARSDDGFVQTYAITSPAMPPLAVNDQVVVRAKREGEAVTAITVGPPLPPGH